MATSNLMTGLPSNGALWFDSDDPVEVELRKTVGVDALQELLAETGVFDGIRFVPYASPIRFCFSSPSTITSRLPVCAATQRPQRNPSVSFGIQLDTN